MVTIAGGAGALLTACGATSTSAPAAAGAQTASSTPTSSTPTADPSASESTGSATSGTTLGPTSDVPVGGGVVYPGPKIVVTQPSAGEYKAFSAVCTHQGCLVAGVSDGEIVCNCHGSHYSITDGSVISGPAPSALPTEQLEVSGSDLVLES